MDRVRAGSGRSVQIPPKIVMEVVATEAPAMGAAFAMAAVATEASVTEAALATVVAATEAACVTVAAAMAAVFVTEAVPVAAATSAASRLLAPRAIPTASGAVPIGVTEQGSAIPAVGAVPTAPVMAVTMRDVAAVYPGADGDKINTHSSAIEAGWHIGL